MPLLGDLFYGRVIEPAFIKKQYEKHVFVKPDILTDAFIQERCDIINKPGGQYAPSHFFTGLLDVVQTREVPPISLPACILWIFLWSGVYWYGKVGGVSPESCLRNRIADQFLGRNGGALRAVCDSVE